MSSICPICNQPKPRWESEGECFHCSIGCGPKTQDLKPSVKCRETIAVDKEDLKSLVERSRAYELSNRAGSEDPYDASHILSELDKFLKKYGKNI